MQFDWGTVSFIGIQEVIRDMGSVIGALSA